MEHPVRYYNQFTEMLKNTHTYIWAIGNAEIALQIDAKLINIPRTTFNCIPLDKIHLCFHGQESSASTESTISFRVIK